MPHIDYYKTLGISKTADQKQIKKGYRKMALKWHPDKNPDNQKQAQEQFKLVAQAYSVLKDPKTREIYDKYGIEGLKAQQSGGGGGGPGFSHFNEDMFGGFPSFGHFGGMGGMSGGGMGSDFHSFGGGFSFKRANDIFKQFFGGRDPFEDFYDDDPFNHHKGSKHSKGGGHKSSSPFGMTPFGGGIGGFGDDDFFGGGSGFGGGGFGGGFGQSQFSSFSSGGMGGGGSGSSVSTKTIIRDGKRVTVTQKVSVDSHGNQKKQTIQQVDDGSGNVRVKKQLTGGGPGAGGGYIGYDQDIGGGHPSSKSKKKGPKKSKTGYH